MTRSLTISVHSTVDLITNSSSEIFISAKDSSAKVIKKMIAGIIAASGSTKTVDSYDIEGGDLEFKGRKYRSWDNIYLTEAEAEELGDRVSKQSNEYEYVESEIRVTALVPEAEETAKILSSLESLFCHEAIMNG